jgi:predicted AAA+ superfamily ATPase
MEYRQGAVLDEIQQAPGLVSYLQAEVDEHPEPGRFILTGSQHFGISQTISQSLSGRCGLLTLLSPDFEELLGFSGVPDDLFTLLWQGAYPRIYDQNIPAWHVNIRKQIVKAPKLHFLDTGLVCNLLQIREPGQLRLHPLRGAIFESWVVSELNKALANQGE